MLVKQLTIAELRAEAKHRGLQGAQRLDRSQILSMLPAEQESKVYPGERDQAEMPAPKAKTLDPNTPHLASVANPKPMLSAPRGPMSPEEHRRYVRQRDAGFVDLVYHPELRELTHIITLNADPSDPKRSFQFFGINGFGWKLAIGREVAIPGILARQIASLKMDVLHNTGKRDDEGAIVYETRSMSRFSYSLREALPEEIASLKRRVDYALLDPKKARASATALPSDDQIALGLPVEAPEDEPDIEPGTVEENLEANAT
jgi:hypothetical protein